MNDIPIEVKWADVKDGRIDNTLDQLNLSGDCMRRCLGCDNMFWPDESTKLCSCCEKHTAVYTLGE